MDRDGAIPIVFTEYLVSVPKDYCNIVRKIPDFVQDRFGVKINPDTCKMSDVGHAGILFWSHKGLTKYCEFGRYNSGPKGEEVGVTRYASGGVPDLEFNGDGRPSPKSLKSVLKVVSKKGGHDSRISGVCMNLPGKFSAMKGYCDSRIKERPGFGQNDYSIFNNNCGTFVAKVLNAAGIEVEDKCQPDDFLKILQGKFPKVEYAPRVDALCLEGLVKEKSCI